MKISIQSQAEGLYDRSVTVEISDDINMKEIAETFAGACVAYGFHPDSVKEYVYSEMLDGKFKGDENESY